MTFVSIVAEASTQPGATAPAWLVPLITGAVGLFGTIIGGTITFFSTRSADKRKEKAETKRQKNAQIKDISVRFLQTLSHHGIESMKIKETAERLKIDVDSTSTTKSKEIPAKSPEPQEIHETAAPSETGTAGESTKSPELLAREEQLREAQALVAEKQAKLDGARREAERVNLMTRAFGEIDQSTKERAALLTEMYLILPNSTIRKAEKASSAVLMRELTAYLPKDLQPEQSVSRDAINEFVTDIRSLVGMDAFIPPPMDFEFEFAQVLEKVRAEKSTDSP